MLNSPKLTAGGILWALAAGYSHGLRSHGLQVGMSHGGPREQQLWKGPEPYMWDACLVSCGLAELLALLWGAVLRGSSQATSASLGETFREKGLCSNGPHSSLEQGLRHMHAFPFPSQLCACRGSPAPSVVFMTDWPISSALPLCLVWSLTFLIFFWVYGISLGHLFLSSSFFKYVFRVFLNGC